MRLETWSLHARPWRCFGRDGVEIRAISRFHGRRVAVREQWPVGAPYRHLRRRQALKQVLAAIARIELEGRAAL